MNQSTPIIASDEVGAVAGGLVRHERNGLVVQAGDATALARALRRLHDDPQLRARLGAQRTPRRLPLHLRLVGRRLRTPRCARYGEPPCATTPSPSQPLLALLAGGSSALASGTRRHQRLHRRRGPGEDLHAEGVPRRAREAPRRRRPVRQLPRHHRPRPGGRREEGRLEEDRAGDGRARRAARRRRRHAGRPATGARRRTSSKPAAEQLAAATAARSRRGRRPRRTTPRCPRSPRADVAAAPARQLERPADARSSSCSRCCSPARSRSPPSASEALSTPAALERRTGAGTLSVPGLQAQPLLTTGLAAILCAVAFTRRRRAADRPHDARGDRADRRRRPGRRRRRCCWRRAASGCGAAGRCCCCSRSPSLTALSIAWAANPSDTWLEANRTFAYLAVFAGGDRARARGPAPLGRGARRDHAVGRRHQRVRRADEDPPGRAEPRRDLLAAVGAVRLLEQRRPDGGARRARACCGSARAAPATRRSTRSPTRRSGCCC